MLALRPSKQLFRTSWYNFLRCDLLPLLRHWLGLFAELVSAFRDSFVTRYWHGCQSVSCANLRCGELSCRNSWWFGHELANVSKEFLNISPRRDARTRKPQQSMRWHPDDHFKVDILTYPGGPLSASSSDSAPIWQSTMLEESHGVSN